jgi:hypothetical protein
MTDDRRPRPILDSERRDLMDALANEYVPACAFPTCDATYEGLIEADWTLYPAIVLALCPQHTEAEHVPTARWVQRGDVYVQRGICSCGDVLGDHTTLYGCRDAYVTHLEQVYIAEEM